MTLTIDETLDYINAFKNGQTIERKRCQATSTKDIITWETVPSFERLLYYIQTGAVIRLKPKLEHHPYSNCEQILVDMKKYGPLLRKKDDSTYYSIVRLSNSITSKPYLVIHTMNNTARIEMKDLLLNYAWQSDTACGIIKSE